VGIQNKVLKVVGNPRDDPVKSHTDIGEEYGLLEFQQASKLSGSKFVILKNEAALLELALSNWAFNLVAREYQYEPLVLPDLANVNIVEACGF